MWQTINLTNYADPSLIDSGAVKFDLSAWIGGYIDQDDLVVVGLAFFNQNNQVVGNVARIGPVMAADRYDVTSFLFRTTTGTVPIGARSVVVLANIIRNVGDIADGYVDNINVSLHQ